MVDSQFTQMLSSICGSEALQKNKLFKQEVTSADELPSENQTPSAVASRISHIYSAALNTSDSALLASHLMAGELLQKIRRHLLYYSARCTQQHRTRPTWHYLARDMRAVERPDAIFCGYRGQPLAELYLDGDPIGTALIVHRVLCPKRSLNWSAAHLQQLNYLLKLDSVCWGHQEQSHVLSSIEPGERALPSQ
ncbi:hypothetical protein DPMN_151477 [Dreissena polymorpha]|uniref:Uncharacterized protein n=1 Tax=Dreissena polymorpha TaxID=45954 RepID=A0A9D4FFE2_DREPO|nr:hypothetical protein DPMN_151477 [Dreissena polymorpha]